MLLKNLFELGKFRNQDIFSLLIAPKSEIVRRYFVSTFLAK
jgi:hypothetical protein